MATTTEQRNMICTRCRNDITRIVRANKLDEVWVCARCGEVDEAYAEQKFEKVEDNQN